MPTKSTFCGVVADAVTITLRRSRSPSGRGRLFVRCSEKDCLYIDVNRPPCPLSPRLFDAEMRVSGA